MANSFTSKMKGYFGLTYKKGGFVGADKTIYPATKDPKTGQFTNKPVDYVPNVERYMREYFQDTYETRISLRNRIERYNALDAMVKNDGYICQAVDTYCDESTQADAQSQIISVKAEGKLQKWIYDFFNNIGITEQTIRDAAYNVVLYGDGFWVHDITEKGVVGIYPVSPYSVSDRLEFSPVQIGEILRKKFGGMYTVLNSSAILKNITQIIANEKETYATSDYFRSYLFGFALEEGEMYLPPWGMTHFKRFTSQSEFWPFGRPLMINTVSRYKAVHSAQIIQAAIRANSFPVKIWNVDCGDYSNSADRWGAVSEFKNEMQNLGLSQSQGEPVVAAEFFMPKGQAELQMEDPSVDLNQIADIENLEENMITSTGIPPSFILPGQGGFGNSGDSLLRQDKKFARRVYTIQSAILEGLTSLVHLQMVMTGAYDYEKANFELSMHYPVSEETSDKMRGYSDSLRLASDIISSISTTMGLGRDEALPIDVVKQIFSNYSFLPPDEIETWIKAIEVQKKQNEEAKLTEKRIKERLAYLDENVALEEYFNAKERLNLKEGALAGRHYLTSKQVTKESKLMLETMLKHFGNSGKKLTEALSYKRPKEKIDYKRNIDKKEYIKPDRI